MQYWFLCSKAINSLNPKYHQSKSNYRGWRSKALGFKVITMVVAPTFLVLKISPWLKPQSYYSGQPPKVLTLKSCNKGLDLKVLSCKAKKKLVEPLLFLGQKYLQCLKIQSYYFWSYNNGGSLNILSLKVLTIAKCRFVITGGKSLKSSHSDIVRVETTPTLLFSVLSMIHKDIISVSVFYSGVCLYRQQF